METQNNQTELHGILQEMRLKHLSHVVKEDLTQMPPKEASFIVDNLTKWLRAERAERKSLLIASRVRSAKFRRTQTVDNFDFKYSNSTQGIQKAYLGLFNSIDSQNLPSAIFTGTAGAGKTHLARALGYAACQKGLSVLFLSAAEMVNQLAHAQKAFNLENELRKYRRPQVLIIDELGYVTMDAQASNLFFQVISARHDQELGTIATTNLNFGQFNQIFANDAIAHAIVDRLANAAEVFFMEGPTYRDQERKEKQKRRVAATATKNERKPS